jgi:hypothetical protein
MPMGLTFVAQEAHNLAEDPVYAQICLKFERVILKWMVSTSDYVPFDLDPRFPAVELESTKSQTEKRAAASRIKVNGKFNH